MAVVAPVVSAPLLGTVSHLPRGDWRIGAPFYFCALRPGSRRWSLAVAALQRRAPAPRVDAAATPRTT